MRVVRVLLVKAERVNLHDLAVIPDDVKPGVLRDYSRRCISSTAEIRKIDNAQDRAALSIDRDFSVEDQPRLSVAKHERINRINGFTISAYRDAALEKLAEDLADSRP